MGIEDRKSIHRVMNKENSVAQQHTSSKNTKDRHKEIDQAAEILKRKMKQMEAEQSKRDTYMLKQGIDEDESENES